MKVILPLCPTTNHTYRHSGHVVYMTKEAKEWITEALWLLKGQERPLQDPTELSITYYLKRDRDVDGSNKIVIDTLAKAGWFTNDSKLQDLHLHKRIDKLSPRIEIQL